MDPIKHELILILNINQGYINIGFHTKYIYITYYKY